MISFTKILAADLYKTRRTGNMLLALAVPTASTLLAFGYFAYRGVTNPMLKDGADTWGSYSQMILVLYVMLFPLFAAVLAFSMSNIEHKNRGLKQIFTLPAKKSSLYFSKVVLQLALLLLSLLFGLGILYGSGAVLDLMFPALKIDQGGSFPLIASYLLKCFVTLVAIVAIHFFISIYWNNFVVSVGTACFMVVVGLGMASWQYGFVLPYTHIPTAISAFEAGEVTFLTREVYWSLGYAAVFFAVGYWMMLKKSIKS